MWGNGPVTLRGLILSKAYYSTVFGSSCETSTATTITVVTILNKAGLKNLITVKKKISHYSFCCFPNCKDCIYTGVASTELLYAIFSHLQYFSYPNIIFHSKQSPNSTKSRKTEWIQSNLDWSIVCLSTLFQAIPYKFIPRNPNAVHLVRALILLNSIQYFSVVVVTSFSA